MYSQTGWRGIADSHQVKSENLFAIALAASRLSELLTVCVEDTDLLTGNRGKWFLFPVCVALSATTCQPVGVYRILVVAKVVTDQCLGFCG